MPDETTEPHGPLHGVKVVACSTAQAGTVPYMLMADLGAEVIKIEAPGVGDNSRGSTVLPGLPSTYFETNNRGVKSLTLNLKTAEGREILRKLVAQRGHLRAELPAGRGGEEWLRLRRAEKGQPQARLCLGLGLRAQRTACRSAGHRFDGPGAGRHRPGLFDPGPDICAPASSRSPTRPARSWRLAGRSPH